jgi:hypothetical protein
MVCDWGLRCIFLLDGDPIYSLAFGMILADDNELLGRLRI